MFHLQFLFPDAKPNWENDDKSESENESNKPNSKYSHIREVRKFKKVTNLLHIDAYFVFFSPHYCDHFFSFVEFVKAAEVCP